MTTDASKSHYLTLTAVWAIACGLAGWWLAADRTPFPWDMSGHAGDAFNLWHDLCRFKLYAIYTQSDYYPPLFHLVAAPITLIASAPDAYCVANWAGLAALMLLTGWLARELERAGADGQGTDDGEAWLGTAAAALTPGYVMLAWMLRMPMVDLLLAATTTWTLGLLVRIETLRTPREATLVGLSIALGMLTKWPYLFFTGLPLACWAWRQFHPTRWRAAMQQPTWRPGACATRLLLWPVLLAGPWYLRALPHILSKVAGQLGGEVAAREGDPAVFTFAALSTYPTWLYEHYLRLPLALMLLAGALALAMRWRRGTQARRAGWRLVGLGLGSGLVILTLIANKDARYVMPLIPLLAILSTQWIRWLPRGKRWIGGLGAAGLAIAMLTWNFTVFAPPDRREMQIENVAQWVIEHKPHGRKRVKMLVVPNDWLLNAAALDFALMRRDRRSRAERAKAILSAKRLKDFDYVLLAEPPEEDSGISPHGIENTRFMQNQTGWTIIQRFERGDGKRLDLYQRIPDAA